MNHANGGHASHRAVGEHPDKAQLILADPRHPDAAFIQRELDLDRKREWYLIPKAIFALLIVAVLVLVRQLYFA